MLEIQNLTYYSVPEEGFEITLELNPTGSVDLQLSDRTWDLPTELLREKSIEIKPRPADMMRMPNFDYDSIVVTTIKLQRKK